MGNDKWGTPPEVYNKLNEEFQFDAFDPCPLNWKPGDPDGLAIDWAPRTFVNPPYSQTSRWLKKSARECKKGKLVVLLLNACTDTKYFHKYVLGLGHEVRFIRGRLRFIQLNGEPAPSSNTRPSIIIIMRPQNEI